MQVFEEMQSVQHPSCALVARFCTRSEACYEARLARLTRTVERLAAFSIIVLKILQPLQAESGLERSQQACRSLEAQLQAALQRAERAEGDAASVRPLQSQLVDAQAGLQQRLTASWWTSRRDLPRRTWRCSR